MEDEPQPARRQQSGSAMTFVCREALHTRLRRLLHAAVDEATLRVARFVFRNRASMPPPPCPVSTWTERDRREVVNPALEPPSAHARACPKIIFQTWKSRVTIPDNYRYWRQTFINNNPNHIAVLWDDDDNRTFITHNFPWFLDIYNSYPSEIYRADAVRYFFLLRYGGLYADMDTECLTSIDETTALGDVVLCRMGPDRTFRHSLPNAVMSSRPGQIFWLFVIRLMMEAKQRCGREYQGPEEMTGPILLKRAFDAFSRLDSAAAWAAVRPIRARLSSEQMRILSHGTIFLLKSRAWYPLDWTNPVHKLLRTQLLERRQLLPSHVARQLFPRSTVVTYWTHSW
jgi:mannosyltransferase OCH1-like enzyme